MKKVDARPFADVSPGTVMRDLAVEIVAVQHTIRAMKKDLLAFADGKTLKAWLKGVRRRPRSGDIDDLLF